MIVFNIKFFTVLPNENSLKGFLNLYAFVWLCVTCTVSGAISFCSVHVSLFAYMIQLPVSLPLFLCLCVSSPCWDVSMITRLKSGAEMGGCFS